eukprot:TRINITY_DN28097_c0_g1_i1.p1 TRINITY_DN28097_c0_g1~~TRINITY_DN28097_c0_g1_i1.p1  ORF type:complete len:328 (+),score=97.18 TRINITY_DN28097_c0_g1_i1:49-1032(+)
MIDTNKSSSWVAAACGLCVASSAATVLLGLACFKDRLIDAVEREMARRAVAQMPSRIILVRHGESEANVDPSVWNTKPDNRIELTEKGVGQAQRAGRAIKALVGDNKIVNVLSPFWRTNMTSRNILQHLDEGQVLETRVEPRVREQEFGNYQEAVAMKANRATQREVGRFWYRFPEGESGADVYERVAAALTDIKAINSRRKGPQVEDVLVVTHGLAMRLFLAAAFKWSPDTFETVYNPENCEVWVLKKDPTTGRYSLSDEGAMPKSTRKVNVHFKDGRVEPHVITDYLSLPQPRTCHPEAALERLSIPADEVERLDFWSGTYKRFA